MKLWSRFAHFSRLHHTFLLKARQALSPGDRERSNAVEAALARQVAGDFPDALDLWENIRIRWPQDPTAYAGLAACARQVGRIDRAQEIVAEGMQRFPSNRNLIAEAAQTEQMTGNWERSVALWERVIKRPRSSPIWLHLYGHALLVCGEYDKLEKMLKLSRKLHPEKSSFLALEAMLAGEREDWERAVQMWRDFREAFPEDAVGWEHYGRACQELEFSRRAAQGDEDAAVPMDQVRVDVVDDEAARLLLLGFEGLGSDCEFGLVQRRFGAEPLSLLRFNAVTFGGLTSGLANRLEGMGSPETTEIITLANGEYFIRDRRWGLGMHTFKFVGQVDADLLYRKFCERVVFLRDKLLSDLADGRKIFVFFAPGMAMSDLKMLHALLKGFGPVNLLHVTTVEAARDAGLAAEAGSVDPIEPDLYVGYLSRTGRTTSGFWDIAFDEWVALCRKVRATADLGGKGSHGV